MPFVSDLMGKPVCDDEGKKIGVLKDLIAASPADVAHPEIVAVEVRSAGGSRYIPLADVAVLVAPVISLARPLAGLAPYEPAEGDLFLVRDILDQQIIDVNDVRVVRVNDVELARVNGRFYLANVDIGTRGLLRRLGILRLYPRRLGRAGKTTLPPGMISWEGVEPIAKNRQLRLKVPGDKIEDLHPADIAEIVSDLGRSEGSKFLETLDAKTAAETLEEVETDFQASLVKTMPDEKVADVLEEMAPDEAADLLAELPEERSQELLKKLEKDTAKDVRKLLSYPEDTAGGIMTTEFITMAPARTATQAIKAIRQEASGAETIFYVYVTDKKGTLLGVFSLKQLVLAEPRTKVQDFMQSRTVTVNVRDSQDEVAQIVSKYNLLAVPVVDDQGRLQGIVTADDALDKIIPTAWKKRIPRLYH
jgi:magnesium transporter